MKPEHYGYVVVGIALLIVVGFAWWSLADKATCDKKGGVYSVRVGLCFDRKAFR